MLRRPKSAARCIIPQPTLWGMCPSFAAVCSLITFHIKGLSLDTNIQSQNAELSVSDTDFYNFPQ